jgi:hypothetical protein
MRCGSVRLARSASAGKGSHLFLEEQAVQIAPDIFSVAGRNDGR